MTQPGMGFEGASPEDLAARISAMLRTARFGRPLHVHALTGSTNDLARELVAGGAPHGTAVLALEQSAGRGRLGRSWVSSPGGLYLSLVLRPEFPVERWPLIGLACALGAAVAAEAHARRGPGAMDASLRVKWPNDLLLDGRKVGGILVEAADNAAICGIGLNVVPQTRSGPSWTSRRKSVDNAGRSEPMGAAMPESEHAAIPGLTGATWLATRNPAVSVAALAPDVLLECERWYLTLTRDSSAILAEWRARTVTLGKRVRVEATRPFEGMAEDIDADGALLVRTSGGLRQVRAGDVVTYELDASGLRPPVR